MGRHTFCWSGILPFPLPLFVLSQEPHLGRFSLDPPAFIDAPPLPAPLAMKPEGDLLQPVRKTLRAEAEEDGEVEEERWPL